MLINTNLDIFVIFSSTDDINILLFLFLYNVLKGYRPFSRFRLVGPTLWSWLYIQRDGNRSLYISHFVLIDCLFVCNKERNRREKRGFVWNIYGYEVN